MGKIEAMMVQPGGSLVEDYIIGASIAYVFGSHGASPAPAPATIDRQKYLDISPN